jgi:hypothetical protein
MIPKVPEKNKLPGVCYALTDDGVELPIIDITNPAFTEIAGPAQLAELSEDYLRFQRWPAFLRRFFSSHSIAMRGLGSASGKFLGGMTTYVAKLTPKMLGKGYAGIIDRKVASAVGSVSFRIRLQSMARLMADGLAPLLEARPGSPVRMLNIAGGPATDSLNALIVLHKEHPGLLDGRPIRIHVLDVDQAGPNFGQRALSALLQQGAPLHALDISFDATQFDWTQVSELEKIVRSYDPGEIMAGSSEGGLFEYGADATIQANLDILQQRTTAGFFLVGSIMQDGPVTRSLHATSSMSLRMFEPQAFEALVDSSAWCVERVLDGNPIYRVVRLQKDRK